MGVQKEITKIIIKVDKTSALTIARVCKVEDLELFRKEIASEFDTKEHIICFVYKTLDI